MKKLNLLGVFFLTIVMLSTGCHRKPTGLTPVPGMTPPPGQENNVPPGANLNPEPGPVANANGTVPEGDNGIYKNTLEHGKENREKFAGDTIYFDFDSASIKPSEESKLQAIADYFKNNSSLDALVIEGNCDERGTEKYNLSLGERRALAAREYLSNLGVNAQRIKTVTYGASKPVDPGHNESAWHKNRRDEFVLMTPQ